MTDSYHIKILITLDTKGCFPAHGKFYSLAFANRKFKAVHSQKVSTEAEAITFVELSVRNCL